MLYEKSKTKQLDIDLFQQPTSEYRGAPFWAWNTTLNKEELLWQFEVFKQMGFGGAHMHVRTGMGTTYLSDEHMELIKAVVDKAKQEDMKAYLYDEDRWPSGPAGGIVTRDKKYRARYLLFTPEPYGSKERSIIINNSAAVRAGRTENGRLLACFDVELNADGYLVGSRVIGEHEEPKHNKWYAYLETFEEISWWNGQTYVNVLDKKALDRFIEVTYETYYKNVSDEFDKVIPSIFTDEPQFPHKTTLKFATDKTDVTLPWTDDLADTYAEHYEGEDLLQGIPELIWDRADRQISVIRYHYHDHVCERFSEAFADNCGRWCREHGLALTGHMMKEPTLKSQTFALGEAMRAYRGFGIPGIDMLRAAFEYTTAKQTQSAVHQYGKEGMLSELYGVTNWDFDFRGHKLHGDWQAALGVTLRVPHLSFVSMEGEAKRDYPASIHYQSPWYEKYALVEDHFARVNTALTRGKAKVRVGVIHPIESYWLHWGPSESTAMLRENLDENFQNLTKWLLFGGIDFDFISESLLPELCKKGGAPLQVGEMCYDLILVPGCETLRSTTLERLDAFAKQGGRLIFAGELPSLENARPSDRGLKLAKTCQCVQFNRGSILSALEEVRMVELRDESGAMTDNLLHQLREDGDGMWLFVAHGKEPYNKHISKNQKLRIRVKGTWKASIYDTLTGDIQDISQSVKGNITELYHTLYDYDSLLVRLEPLSDDDKVELQIAPKTEQSAFVAKELRVPSEVAYTLSEPNVLLIDKTEFALNEEDWHEEEELLRADVACRKMLGWSTDIAHVAQPWSLPKDDAIHRVRLRKRIQSDVELEGIRLAIEHADLVQIWWNGEKVSNKTDGYFTDKSIKTIKLPKLKYGENILEVSVPIGLRIMVEWMYLLGNFGVEVCGKNTRIVPKKEQLAFGSIVSQGLPFYSGNITYHVPIETSGGDIQVRSGFYSGAMQEVALDENPAEAMIYPPYEVKFEKISAGKHMLHFTLYGNRYNSFGNLHMVDQENKFVEPKLWRTSNDEWCYEYMLRDLGIMATPLIQEQKKEIQDGK